MNQLNEFFESKVNVARIKFGKEQTIETLINEEALLFAKYLRSEKKTWHPRIESARYRETQTVMSMKGCLWGFNN